MLSWPILSLVLFLPLVGALFIVLFVRGEDAAAIKSAQWTALWTTFVTFALSLLLWFNFDPTTPDFQFVEKFDWMPDYGLSYHLGVDGISLMFVVLTTFIMPICTLQAFQGIRFRVKEFMVAFLVLETMMIGVFVTLDLVMFYVFFEGVLIPMFLIIGVWGGNNRVYAAFKFFLYTLLGSVLKLLAVLAVILTAGTADIPTLMDYPFPADMQYWLWLAFFASFAVKVPMWPVHTWLPDAHPEAPTKGSVILAAVLLKLGGYGFLRFSIPMFPIASDFFAPLIFALSAVAVIYTSLVALVQTQMKRLIAYSSVAHMGFVTAGIFSFEQQALEGAMFMMISHGLISGALFLMVGVLHDRVPSYKIESYGGVVHAMPLFAVFSMVFLMANAGLPGTSGFVGEFMILLGTFKASTWTTVLITLGVILAAAYSLWLYWRVFFGKPRNAEIKSLPDMTIREMVFFTPLLVAILWLGIYPSTILDTIHVSVDNLLTNYHQELAAAGIPVELAER